MTIAFTQINVAFLDILILVYLILRVGKGKLHSVLPYCAFLQEHNPGVK